MKADIVSGIRLTGALTAEIIDGKGRFIDRLIMPNLVVQTGRNLIRDFLYGDSLTGLTHFALGTGATTPSAANEQLDTEVHRGTFTNRSKEAGKLIVRYFLGTSDANGNTLTEAGLFGNGATATADSGTLYARTLLSTSIEKDSSIAITFSWDLFLNAT